MTPESNPGPYLTASAGEGMLIIHGSPVTLSRVPRDIVNDALNVGGIVTVGTFDSVEQAKNAARDQYSVPLEDWQASDSLSFGIGGRTETEIHTPEIDGHKLLRHGIRWK
jgi:hypothetical protein